MNFQRRALRQCLQRQRETGGGLICITTGMRGASCPHSQPVRGIRLLRIGDNPRSATILGRCRQTQPVLRRPDEPGRLVVFQTAIRDDKRR
jgi:hypothetical protein